MLISSGLLRALRAYFGISAKEFCKDLGISASTLSRIEQDSDDILTAHESTLIKIISYYKNKGAIIFEDTNGMITISFESSTNISRKVNVQTDSIYKNMPQEMRLEMLQNLASSLKKDVG